MTWSLPKTRLRVSINGVVVHTSDEINVNEGLDQVSRTADFLLAAQPDPQPAEGDDVLIQLIDQTGSLVYALFGGTIDSLDVESEPWAYSVVCCDQLEKLRATRRGSSLELTGLTEGEAWKAVMDYVGVTYDDADVSDSGYVLGAQQTLKWKNDGETSASSVISELDTIFGMYSTTIQDNRVIRIPLDFTPTTDLDLYRSYTKGVDADWAAHHRRHGDRSAIQPSWKVTGASIESSDNACTSTPWAKAFSGNAQIGKKTHPSRQSIGSDFIQDESLAEAIVRRQMRRFNRSPDNASLTVSNEPNLHPGHKIKLIDTTYGIDTGSGRRCLITSVVRSGLTMTAETECGAPGDEGTVTTGVDKVCGDDHTDPDLDDGFDPPTPLYPPLDSGDPFTDDLTGTTPFDVITPFPFVEPPSNPENCVTDDYSSALTIETGKDWELEGDLTLNDGGDSLKIGVDTDDGFYGIRIAGGAFYDPMVGQFRYELLSPTAANRATGYAPLGIVQSWRVIWNDVLKTLTFYAQIGGEYYFEELDCPTATMASAETSETVTGSPTRSSELAFHDCDAGTGAEDRLSPIVYDWTCGSTHIDHMDDWTMSSDTLVNRGS